MMRRNPINKPHIYTILYFGESGNLDDMGFWRSHHKYTCFIEKVRAESNLFIGIHAMPGSTPAERRGVEERLNDRYEPDFRN